MRSQQSASNARHLSAPFLVRPGVSILAPSYRDRSALRVTIAAAAFLFCYADVLTQLIRQWSDNSTYSYGFAVPLIAGYIVWQRWPELRSVARTPETLAGTFLIVAGALMLVIGRVGGLMALQGISLLLTLAGVVLLLAGREILRRLRFPIAYLVMMLPIWGVFIAWLQLPGQRAAATMATSLLRAVGIPALHQGTTIVLPTISLQVMPECSGINQLIALTIMALPAAYLWIPGRLRRLIFVAAAIVLGYLSNALRVAILGWLTNRQLPVGDPHSALHLAPGFVSIALAYVVLGILLPHLSRGRGADHGHASPTVPTVCGRRVVRRPWAEALAISIMTAAGASPLIAMPIDAGRTDARISLPTQFSEWSMVTSTDAASARFAGFDETLLGTYHTPTGERRFSGVDEEFLRTYRSSSGAEVEIYVGYYRHQAEGKELSGDVAHALQRIAGTVQVSDDSGRVAVSEVIQQLGDTYRGVVFWYDINGRIVSSIYKAKLFTLWGALAHRRTNGAVVMVAWRGPGGASGTRARLDALAFCRALLSSPNDIVP
jgi:EpsI family protein